MSRRDKSQVEVVDDRTVQVVAGTGPWRPLGALGLALVSWLPSARALLQGDLDVTVASVRFLVAVGVAWVGLGLVATVLRGYVTAPDQSMPAHRRRRRTDGSDGGTAGTTRSHSEVAGDESPAVDKVVGVDAIDVSATETGPA